MFNFLRNLTKSAEEKRQETVAAYLDGALHGRSRQQFEQEMAQNGTLRQQVEQLRLIKQSLRQLPPRQVPRNFLLDPAAYGRPARQPWVQAYPVLRTATAMAAFFLIFAVAASIFTSAGSGETAVFAPAANIAQSEAVELTRVTTEVVSEEGTFAFDTEADAAAEIAEEPVIEAEVAASDEAEEVMVEEEVSAEEEAPPAEPETVESLQGDAAEDGVTSAPQATAAYAAPTPTESTLPRIASPTPLPDRDMDEEAGGEAANDVVADVLETEDDRTSVAATAVPPDEFMPDVIIDQPNQLSRLQIGLGLLLLLLAGLTFYARRQR